MRTENGVRQLYTADQIAIRVRELGAEVAARYHGREVTVVSVLTGALVFTADLLRARAFESVTVRLEVVKAAATLDPRPAPDLALIDWANVRGRDVLLVDDVIATGRTMLDLYGALKSAGAGRVDAVALFSRAGAAVHPADSAPPLVGFPDLDLGDDQLVGYGMDHRGRYRNRSWVGRVPADLG